MLKLFENRVINTMNKFAVSIEDIKCGRFGGVDKGRDGGGGGEGDGSGMTHDAMSLLTEQHNSLLLVLAAAITSAVLQITAPRRARSFALAFVGGAIGALLVLFVFNGSAGPATAASLLFALSFLLVDLLVGLATFDMQRFTDRFRPLATEHELRATFDAVDDLRDEAASAFAEEVGGAVGAADAAIAPARKVVRAAADALRGIADRLRERRGAGDEGDNA